MHDYTEGCACTYCKTMDQIIRQYRREDKVDAFRRMYGIPTTDPGPDPFEPPRSSRFRVQHPPYEQRRKQVITGAYRRLYDKAMDMFLWQYQPWIDGEWVTYYKLSAEMLHRDIKQMGQQLAAKKFHNAANDALSKERFYKVERVDTTA